MTEIADYTHEELAALARAVQLFEELHEVLGRVEAFPRDHTLVIDSEVEPYHLGVIGYSESGCMTFQPGGKA